MQRQKWKWNHHTRTKTKVGTRVCKDRNGMHHARMEIGLSCKGEDRAKDGDRDKTKA
jgi:hypothetical protein